jgi:lipid A 3-O-deacylase
MLFISLEAQEIDNTNAYRNLYGTDFIRLGGDDDFIHGTDEEYTEGINLEISKPWVKKFPLAKLLLNPNYAITNYGIGIEQAGYTPRDIVHEYFRNTSRPFASFLLLKTFLFATDPYWKQSFSASLYTGVIGPAGLGEVLQDNAHALIHEVQPPGWKYQVHNDIAINYEVNYEKQLFSYGQISLSATAMGKAGTLSDALSQGINLFVGTASPYAKKAANTKNIRAYIYDHPAINFVFYDATLQGGMFDHSNPYVFSDINHIVFSNRTGFAISFDNISIEAYHCFITSEYAAGPAHNWDGIQLGIILADKDKNRPRYK